MAATEQRQTETEARPREPWTAAEYEAARRAGYLLARQLGRSVDEALDVVQEASERAWRYRHSLHGTFQPWFLGIVHRIARRPRFPWLPLPERWDSHADPVLIGDDLGVLDALRRLPRRQRIALWLHYGEDMAIADVARSLETTPAATKQLLYRAREALKKEVQDEQ